MPIVTSGAHDGAVNINAVREQLQNLEISATALTMERMNAEALWNEKYSNKQLLADPLTVSEYKRNMAETMRSNSNAKCGYIVWLNLHSGLPPLEHIKAHIIFPKDSDSKVSRLRIAAKRFTDPNDLRFRRDYYGDTCSFTDLRLSKTEKVYIDELHTNPMKWAKELQEADDWHPLPLMNLEQHFPKVSSSLILLLSITDT